jgi:hypothetical protein
MNRERFPLSERVIDRPIQTGDWKLDDIISVLNPAECLDAAKTFEKWASAIRSALGRAGHGPRVKTSCMEQRNVHLDLGLSKHQMQRLKQAAKALLHPKHRSSATAAWYLLNTALSNLEIMETLVRKDAAASGWQSNGAAFEKHWDGKSRASLRSLN